MLIFAVVSCSHSENPSQQQKDALVVNGVECSPEQEKSAEEKYKKKVSRAVNNKDL